MPISVVAHRGNCLNEYENTLESVKAAIDAGITFIEIDIQLTKDSIPIVFHDPDWLRMTGQKGLVSETHSQDLIHHKITSPLKHAVLKKTVDIALLSEVVTLLKQHPTVTLFVEVKTEIFINTSYKKVYKTLMQVIAPVFQQIVIISFSYRFLRLCKKLSLVSLGYVLPTWKDYSPKMLERLRPQFIFCDLDIFPAAFKVKTKSPEWVLYECSEQYDPNEYFKQGVNYVETYYPTQLLERVACNS